LLRASAAALSRIVSIFVRVSTYQCSASVPTLTAPPLDR
jgi:hypothetical protein